MLSYIVGARLCKRNGCDVKYAAVFFLVATIFTVEAAILGGWGWVLVWPAASFLGVAVAYAGVGPRVFGKRDDGALGLLPLLFFSPYLLPTWGLWHVLRWFSTQPACQEIVPGIWLGRRLLAGEVPPGIGLIVDLTAEFVEPTDVKADRVYVALPTLDGEIAALHRLREVVEQILATNAEVLIHCASGHGRSAMVVACVLIAKGLAADAETAEDLIRTVRPKVALSGSQRKLVDRFAAAITTD